jgi:hypothetical protein
MMSLLTDKDVTVRIAIAWNPNIDSKVVADLMTA